MSRDAGQVVWTRLSRARGPRVRVTRMASVWLGGFASLFVVGGIDREHAATAVGAAILVAATLWVLVRTWMAGLFTDGTYWELRGVLDRTRILRSTVTAVGLAEDWGLGGPVRMLRISRRAEEDVTFPFIAWGSALKSLRYGKGISNEASPRQAVVLDALRADAQLGRAPVHPAN